MVASVLVPGLSASAWLYGSSASGAAGRRRAGDDDRDDQRRHDPRRPSPQLPQVVGERHPAVGTDPTRGLARNSPMTPAMNISVVEGGGPALSASPAQRTVGGRSGTVDGLRRRLHRRLECRAASARPWASRRRCASVFWDSLTSSSSSSRRPWSAPECAGAAAAACDLQELLAPKRSTTTRMIRTISAGRTEGQGKDRSHVSSSLVECTDHRRRAGSSPRTGGSPVPRTRSQV